MNIIVLLSPCHNNFTARTFSLQESLKVAAPGSSLWLDLVHGIKVEIWHHVVFAIAGHVDDLRKEPDTSIL